MMRVRPASLFDWNDSNVAMLLRLWDEGKSAAVIATEIGAGSRSVVIGKIHRLRTNRLPSEPLVTKRATVVRKPSPKRVWVHPFRPKPVPAVNPEPAAISDLPADQPDNPVTIMQLTEHTCRWPCSGAGAETVFCGGEPVKGKSYCSRHYYTAHQKRSVA